MATPQEVTVEILDFTGEPFDSIVDEKGQTCVVAVPKLPYQVRVNLPDKPLEVCYDVELDINGKSVGYSRQGDGLFHLFPGYPSAKDFSRFLPFMFESSLAPQDNDEGQIRNAAKYLSHLGTMTVRVFKTNREKRREPRKSSSEALAVRLQPVMVSHHDSQLADYAGLTTTVSQNPVSVPPALNTLYDYTRSKEQPLVVRIRYDTRDHLTQLQLQQTHRQQLIQNQLLLQQQKETTAQPTREEEHGVPRQDEHEEHRREQQQRKLLTGEEAQALIRSDGEPDEMELSMTPNSTRGIRTPLCPATASTSALSGVHASTGSSTPGSNPTTSPGQAGQGGLDAAGGVGGGGELVTDSAWGDAASYNTALAAAEAEAVANKRKEETEEAQPGGTTTTADGQDHHETEGGEAGAGQQQLRNPFLVPTPPLLLSSRLAPPSPSLFNSSSLPSSFEGILHRQHALLQLQQKEEEKEQERERLRQQHIDTEHVDGGVAGSDNQQAAALTADMPSAIAADACPEAEKLAAEAMIMMMPTLVPDTSNTSSASSSTSSSPTSTSQSPASTVILTFLTTMQEECTSEKEKEQREQQKQDTTDNSASLTTTTTTTTTVVAIAIAAAPTAPIQTSPTATLSVLGQPEMEDEGKTPREKDKGPEAERSGGNSNVNTAMNPEEETRLATPEDDQKENMKVSAEKGSKAEDAATMTASLNSLPDQNQREEEIMTTAGKEAMEVVQEVGAPTGAINPCVTTTSSSSSPVDAVAEEASNQSMADAGTEVGEGKKQASADEDKEQQQRQQLEQHHKEAVEQAAQTVVEITAAVAAAAEAAAAQEEAPAGDNPTTATGDTAMPAAVESSKPEKETKKRKPEEVEGNEEESVRD